MQTRAGALIYILQNIGPILAATMAGLIFGYAYYRALPGPSPAGLTTALAAFAAEFWIAAIIAGALILAPDEAGAWTMALGTAIILFIGFVFPAMLVSNLVAGRGFGPTFRDGGHWLGVFLLQAFVMEALGLVAPPSAG